MQTSMKTALGIVNDALTFGINPSLEPMRRICALLDNPEKRFTCIQVAGTNGKSSTTRYLAALLKEAGYSTGLYTSPELVSITDRIEIEGNPIDEDSFARAVIHVHRVASEGSVLLTEFELITAAALWLFALFEIEYAVLEVGLGGRWDATTVVSPKLVVLTGVDLDHTAILGNTVSEIAKEKAAVIKEGVRVVAAPAYPDALAVFKARATQKNAPFIEVPPVAQQEQDSYQAQNKLTALTAARVLLGATFMSEKKAEETLDVTVIPGRLETVHKDPLIVIDAAHNPASARTLAATLKRSELSETTILLLAVLADKDAQGIIEALVPLFSQIVVTQTASPRAIPAEDLAKLVQAAEGAFRAGDRTHKALARDNSHETGGASFVKSESTPLVFSTTKAALAYLLKQDYPVIATGSITLAGEVKRILQQ